MVIGAVGRPGPPAAKHAEAAVRGGAGSATILPPPTRDGRVPVILQRPRTATRITARVSSLESGQTV